MERPLTWIMVVLAQHVIKAHHLRNDLSDNLRSLDEVVFRAAEQESLRMAWKIRGIPG